ncbi:MAG TPA: M20/M25/M40 family metallo-hydrolase [Candidatus Jeotgalibaca pullicola]|uniref:M20/M25/M40 family metallo-hydrolase n=1 Tax=Candidatus Jeotgalibaca merdavium TaxID=2838627 RepID=A0A9D2I2P2_9LACT|nr:M20/M25/M40 family metallo-hydrolase [Candidatus Jeotgalibaca merdavium]HJB24794.1 M20/M25/M40 family metallo-hydrolase [Candidatus Jeotgalibaca pullicola]
MKNKKKLIILIALVFLCTVSILIFYNSQQSQIESKAENVSEEIIKEANISIDNLSKNHGELAYEYLKYIQRELPGRIAFSEMEEKSAITLLSFIKDIGYNKKNVEIQTIKKETGGSTGIPMQGNPDFDGGTPIDRSYNIVVTKEGNSKKAIIVGAHYDSAGNHGVDDNGAGVSLLLETLNRVKDEEVPFTIKFVFFGAEEVGMKGSGYYVDSMTDEEIKNTLFMINVDTILSGDYAYLYGGSISSDGTVIKDEEVKKAFTMAEELKLDIVLPPIDNPVIPFPTGQKRSDHAHFSDKGIPYVYFEANNWNKGDQIQTEKLGLIMHTNNDDLDFIESNFPNRTMKHLESYSILLNEMLINWE